MKLLTTLSFFFSFLSQSIAISTADARRTLWLCGDSTMAPDGGHNGTEGWGQYLHYSFNSSELAVKNLARAGRSARSFTREGRFQSIFEQTKPGDWAIIEFGHNDGGNPATDKKRRADCPGIGNETCSVTYDNQTEVVYTYVSYLLNATATFLSLGARVILSTPTPNNPYESGAFVHSPSIHEYYAWYAAQQAGGPSKAVYYVNHHDYGTQALQLMGKAMAEENYPMDHTHTAPWLADVFAKAFVLGLKCGTAPLQEFVVNATSRIEGELLGTCKEANSTLPI